MIADTPELHLACWLAHGTVSVEKNRVFGTGAGGPCGKEIVICPQQLVFLLMGISCNLYIDDGDY